MDPTEAAAMKAVTIHSFGGPEVLQLEELPVPEPAQGEVLVRVHAASVNPVDWKTREGKYPPRQRAAAATGARAGRGGPRGAVRTGRAWLQRRGGGLCDARSRAWRLCRVCHRQGR